MTECLTKCLASYRRFIRVGSGRRPGYPRAVTDRRGPGPLKTVQATAKIDATRPRILVCNCQSLGLVVNQMREVILTDCLAYYPYHPLDEADGFLARGVGFEDLGEPSPEHGHMAEVALALGGIDGCEEITREEIGEEDRVAAQRAPGEERPRWANGSLQASPGGGKNSERKAGQERLFGHTL